MAAVSSCRPLVAKTQLLSCMVLDSCGWVASISHRPKDSEQWESAGSMLVPGPNNTERWWEFPQNFSSCQHFSTGWTTRDKKICLDICCFKTFQITRENIKWDSSHRIYKLTSVWLLQEHVEKVIIVWQASFFFTKSNSFT